MIRITEHRRRKLNPAVSCCRCEEVLEPGDTYRQRILINEEYSDLSYERSVAHTHCVDDSEYWQLYQEAPRWKRPSLNGLTKEEQHVILHSLGMGSHIPTSRHGYRNGFSVHPSGEAYELLEAMTAKGLMVRNGERWDLVFFSVTKLGAAKVGRPDLGTETPLPERSAA